MALVGQVKNGRLWVRCWNCGDSSNQHHAHLSINQEGLYHCVRCGVGGKLTPPEFMEHVTEGSLNQLMIEQWKPTEFQKMYSQLLPGPGTSRFSLLERFHLKSERGNLDAFLSKNGLGEDIGVMVNYGKTKIMVGHRGLSWSGEDDLS